MTKFKVGDKVNILTDSHHDSFLKDAFGRNGVIVDICDIGAAEVEFEGPSISESNIWWFQEEGLVKIDTIPDPTPDALIRPSHYCTAGMPEGVAVIDVIKSQGADFLHGNVIKYILRWKWKNGVEDLKKARTYLGWLIEQEEEEAKNTQPVHIPYLDN